MPYKIESRGPRFCVVKDDDSHETMGCHDTRDQAGDHLRALYANEPEAEVADLMNESFGAAADPHQLNW